MITPPETDRLISYRFLSEVHHFVSKSIKDEYLWPFSMTPIISSDNDVPIGNYGTSNKGMFKRIYRNGLANRYGKIMQAISGIHFNYSLPESFWSSELSERNEYKKSKDYFKILRNIYRYNWIILYLFGASPVISEKFIGGNNNENPLLIIFI